MYYHGSQTQITIDGPICLTSSWSAAEEYALEESDTGVIHAIATDGLRLADTDDLHEVGADVLGDLAMYPYDYEIADHDRVRAALAARGFGGVTYGDQTLSGRPHDCMLVWDVDHLTITDTEEC